MPFHSDPHRWLRRTERAAQGTVQCCTPGCPPPAGWWWGRVPAGQGAGYRQDWVLGASTMLAPHPQCCCCPGLAAGALFPSRGRLSAQISCRHAATCHSASWSWGQGAMGAPHRGKKIMPSPSPTVPHSLGSFPAHIYTGSSVLSRSTDSCRH